jgi:hypothetical protein
LAQTVAAREVAMFRFDPFSPETDANPFPAYRRLR